LQVAALVGAALFDQVLDSCKVSTVACLEQGSPPITVGRFNIKAVFIHQRLNSRQIAAANSSMQRLC
jgi:hypothetical protein